MAIRDIDSLLKTLRDNARCATLPPAGLPDVGSYELPEDLATFYRTFGGATIHADAPLAIRICSPAEFQRTNQRMLGEDYTEDRSHNWFVVAEDPPQLISIDLAPARLGRCYDSFWDRHAAGSCAVVAVSFSDLLDRLLRSPGGCYYWCEPGFESLGDAYD